MKRELPCFRQRKSLQVIHEAGEQLGLIQRVVDVVGGRLVNSIQDPFEIALNDVKRRAEFVGDIGGEIAALLLGAFKFADHVIETLCKLSKLTGIMFGDAD